MSWFPLHENMFTSREFSALTPLQKVLFLAVLSEGNMAEESWYRADLEYGVTIGASVDAVRKARGRCAGFGLVEYTPGQLAGGAQARNSVLPCPVGPPRRDTLREDAALPV